MERIKEDRPITIKDDKGNLNRCIADIVSVCILSPAYHIEQSVQTGGLFWTGARIIIKLPQSLFIKWFSVFSPNTKWLKWFHLIWLILWSGIEECEWALPAVSAANFDFNF